MNFKIIAVSSVLVFMPEQIMLAHAEETVMKGHFNDYSVFWAAEHIVRIKGPIQATIRILNTAAEIQKSQSVDIHIVYENPANSGKTGYRKRLFTPKDIELFSAGLRIRGNSWLLPARVSMPTLTDNDFIPMKPGESYAMEWRIDLSPLAMLEGTHQYTISLAGNHVLPSVAERTYKNTQKRAVTAGIKINPIAFSYTKSWKEIYSHPPGYFAGSQFWDEKQLFRIQNPIRVRIDIVNDSDVIQKQHSVEVRATYENPVGSGKIGYWCKSHCQPEFGIVGEGRFIGRSSNLPMVKRHPDPPATDEDFVPLSPGQRHSLVFIIDLNDREMLEGKHQYALIVGSQTIPPRVAKIHLKEKKDTRLLMADDSNSNTLLFTYVKLPERREPNTYDDPDNTGYR